MSAAGHELPSGRVDGMSAKPPIAAVIADVGFVGDVPQPGSCSAAKVPHSITSSAATSSLSGTVSPSTFAVLPLMVSENFVGSWTGKSAGLAP